MTEYFQRLMQICIFVKLQHSDFCVVCVTMKIENTGVSIEVIVAQSQKFFTIRK